MNMDILVKQSIEEARFITSKDASDKETQKVALKIACATMVRSAINMTASKQAKEAGLKSLLQVAELTGQSTQTLNNWFNHKPELFGIVLLGCKYATPEYLAKFKRN